MTKRRAKGEGSVYRRKDGRVVGEYLDANGRKRYIDEQDEGEGGDSKSNPCTVGSSTPGSRRAAR